jgi:septum formation inhibitor-activating ATPase MinD
VSDSPAGVEMGTRMIVAGATVMTVTRTFDGTETR